MAQSVGLQIYFRIRLNKNKILELKQNFMHFHACEKHLQRRGSFKYVSGLI